MAFDFETIALSGLVAAGSSVLTNWLAPKFGHAVWKRQRKEELRLETVEMLLKLTSEFYQGWIKADIERSDRRRAAELNRLDSQSIGQANTTADWSPSMEWYIRKQSIDCRIQALFSLNAREAYSELERRFSPELGSEGPHPNLSAFQTAYSRAFNGLYNDIFNGESSS